MKNDLRALQNASGITVILMEDSIINGFIGMNSAYDEARPEVTQEMREQKIFPAHPSGDTKKNFMFKYFLSSLVDCTADPDLIACIRKLEELKLLFTGISEFTTKHSSPLDDRPWKWTIRIHTTADPLIKSNLAKLIDQEYFTPGCVAGAAKTKGLRIEYSREQQNGIEKKLWTQMKSM